MRYIFFLLIVAGSLISCNNTNSDKPADNPDSSQPERTVPASSRAALFAALKDLQATLESNDKNKVAALFSFPLTDSVMATHLDDSVFQKKYRDAGDQLTKQLFLEYYEPIVKYTNLDYITSLFKYLPIDSLGSSDEMEKYIKSKTNPCAEHYRIELDGDMVRLISGSVENDEYRASKLASEDESTGCEYSVVWMFRMEGSKLKFERYAAAG